MRYRIRVRGLDRIAAPDGRGVLFLANHPALIDPIMLMAVLWSRFRPRVLADRAQARRFGIHFLARRARALEIADMTRDGRGAREQVESMIEASAAALRQGEALLLPASNLDEVLGIRLTSSPLAVPKVPRLMALNIDPEQAAHDYRERMVGPVRGVAPGRRGRQHGGTAFRCLHHGDRRL